MQPIRLAHQPPDTVTVNGSSYNCTSNGKPCLNPLPMNFQWFLFQQNYAPKNVSFNVSAMREDFLKCIAAKYLMFSERVSQCQRLVVRWVNALLTHRWRKVSTDLFLVGDWVLYDLFSMPSEYESHAYFFSSACSAEMSVSYICSNYWCSGKFIDEKRGRKTLFNVKNRNKNTP